MQKTAYDEGYIKWSWGTKPFGGYNEYEKKYYDREIFARSCKNNMKLIDIGYGNGSLISYSRDKGCNVTGLEVNEGLISRARQAGFRVVHNLEELTESGSYDLIIALDVLEHLSPEKAEKMLAHVFRLLKPGSKFVARFPNGDSPFGRVYQNGDITHISALGRGKVEYYCSILNFELEYLGNPVRVEGAGLHRKIKRMMADAARWAIEWTIAKLYFERTVPFNLNYVMVLCKPLGVP